MAGDRPGQGVSLTAVYHRFDSDRPARRHAAEWNLLASARFGRYATSLRYADYRTDRLFVDTRTLWLQLDWTP